MNKECFNAFACPVATWGCFVLGELIERGGKPQRKSACGALPMENGACCAREPLPKRRGPLRVLAGPSECLGLWFSGFFARRDASPLNFLANQLNRGELNSQSPQTALAECLCTDLIVQAGLPARSGLVFFFSVLRASCIGDQRKGWSSISAPIPALREPGSGGRRSGRRSGAAQAAKARAEADANGKRFRAYLPHSCAVRWGGLVFVI